MKIDLKTLSELPIAVDSYGENVSVLLNLGNHLREQPFAMVEKKMFSGKGEIFTHDRFIKFKSNGGFSKLKKEETISYSDVTEFEPFNGSTGLEWKFGGSAGKFTIGLVFYGKVKGISARDIFWYEIDEFPKRSEAFYKLLSTVLPGTGLTADLKASVVKKKLEEAIDLFEGNRTAEDIGLKLALSDVKYPGFTALQQAFSWFLAGTATAGETQKDMYLDIYNSLDQIYVRILKKLMTEYNAGMGNMFTRELKIYEADEKFQRLSSIWYLRQMVSLHFASKYLSKDETAAWPMKVLKPRARSYTSNKQRKVSIKLPETETFQEAIEKLSK